LLAPLHLKIGNPPAKRPVGRQAASAAGVMAVSSKVVKAIKEVKMVARPMAKPRSDFLLMIFSKSNLSNISLTSGGLISLVRKNNDFFAI
jgi:hypothetical protein